MNNKSVSILRTYNGAKKCRKSIQKNIENQSNKTVIMNKNIENNMEVVTIEDDADIDEPIETITIVCGNRSDNEYDLDHNGKGEDCEDFDHDDEEDYDHHDEDFDHDNVDYEDDADYSIDPAVKRPRLISENDEHSAEEMTLSQESSSAQLVDSSPTSSNVTEEINSSNGKSSRVSSRRKTNHRSLKADENITFETYVIPDDDPDDPVENTAESITEKSDLPWTKIPEAKNPNAQLMKKVAFLRVCVNYMMLSLKKKPFDFKKTVSLPWLMSEYNKQRDA